LGQKLRLMIELCLWNR